MCKPGLNVIVNGVVHNHNLGDLFNLAAQTEMNRLNAAGNPVVACRVSTVQQFARDLVFNGPINGGVIYYGHAGVVDGVMVLAVGEQSGPNTNISPSNVNTLSNTQLGTNATITLYACNAGLSWNNQPSIAQLISNRLRKRVYAYEDGIFFSRNPNDRHENGVGLPNPPDRLPMYAIVAGAVPKPALEPFFPQ